MAGDQVAAKLARDYHTSKTPIIFLTEILTKGEAKVLGGKIGDYYVAAKPIIPEDILALVKKLI